jgi:hypothetical protein
MRGFVIVPIFEQHVGSFFVVNLAQRRKGRGRVATARKGEKKKTKHKITAEGRREQQSIPAPTQLQINQRTHLQLKAGLQQTDFFSNFQFLFFMIDSFHHSNPFSTK